MKQVLFHVDSPTKWPDQSGYVLKLNFYRHHVHIWCNSLDGRRWYDWGEHSRADVPAFLGEALAERNWRIVGEVPL